MAIKAGYADVWWNLCPYDRAWIIATWETAETLERAAIDGNKSND